MEICIHIYIQESFHIGIPDVCICSKRRVYMFHGYTMKPGLGRSAPNYPASVFMIVLSSVGKYLCDYPDRKSFVKAECPVCYSSLNIRRQNDDEWCFECEKCNLSASTGYSGITFGDGD
jgi:hypothetical protein